MPSGVCDMSMKHWYPRYVGDYGSKTSHLSMVEHGAYALLLDHYYSTEKPLNANACVLHRVCRAFADAEKDAVQSVLDQFFTLEDDGWHNARVDEELKKRSKIKDKRVIAANNRWGKKQCKSNASASASASSLHMPSTSTSTSTIINKHHTIKDRSVGDGVLKNGGWVVSQLNDSAMQRAKNFAPGWDIYHLAEIYAGQLAVRGMPNSIGAAFPAWCKKYTKGNPP